MKNQTIQLSDELRALEADRRRILARLHMQKVTAGETKPEDLAALDRIKRKINELQLDIAQADPSKLPF